MPVSTRFRSRSSSSSSLPQAGLVPYPAMFAWPLSLRESSEINLEEVGGRSVVVVLLRGAHGCARGAQGRPVIEVGRYQQVWREFGEERAKTKTCEMEKKCLPETRERN